MKKPTLLTIFLVVFMDLIGFGIVMPILPLFAREFHAQGWQLGVILSAYSFMQFLVAPVWGKLSDRVGRRPIILLSLFGSTLSYLIFASSHNLWWILASRLMAGACGANIGVATAYIADITNKENRSKGMGLIGAAFGLGFIFGPVMGGVLLNHHYGFAIPGYLAAAICGINWILAIFYLPESRAGSGVSTTSNHLLKDWEYVTQKPILLLLVMLCFLTNLSFTLWDSTFALFVAGKGYSPHGTSYLFAYIGFVVALLQGGLIGRLVKKYGEPRLMMVSLAAFAVGLAFMPLFPSVWWIVLALTILGLGNGLNRPVIYGLVSKATSEDEQGLVLGVVQSASSLARIIGPLMVGLWLDRWIDFSFWAGAALVLLGFPLALRAVRPEEEACPETE